MAVSLQDVEARSGFAQHKIISEILHEVWFMNKTALGVEFANYFKPISLATLALIFSAVRVLLKLVMAWP